MLQLIKSVCISKSNYCSRWLNNQAKDVKAEPFHDLHIDSVHYDFTSFCFIAVFFLPSSLQAQAVTLTVAQAFKVALDLWEIAQEGEFTQQSEGDIDTVQ